MSNAAAEVKGKSSRYACDEAAENTLAWVAVPGLQSSPGGLTDHHPGQSVPSGSVSLSLAQCWVAYAARKAEPRRAKPSGRRAQPGQHELLRPRSCYRSVISQSPCHGFTFLLAPSCGIPKFYTIFPDPKVYALSLSLNHPHFCLFVNKDFPQNVFQP